MVTPPFISGAVQPADYTGGIGNRQQAIQTHNLLGAGCAVEVDVAAETLLRTQSQRFHFFIQQVGELDFFRAGDVATFAGIIKLNAVGHQFSFIHCHAIVKLVPRKLALLERIAFGIIQRVG